MKNEQVNNESSFKTQSSRKNKNYKKRYNKNYKSNNISNENTASDKNQTNTSYGKNFKSNKNLNHNDNTGNIKYSNNRKKYKNRYYKNKNIPSKSIDELEQEYLIKRQNDGQEKPTCQICGQNIDIIETAIKYKDGEELCHFDCILEELKNDNTLERSESIAYLGGGTFGVIKTMVTKNSKKFFVRKRIIYEKKDFYDYKLENN